MKHEAAVMEPKQGFRAQFALWAELVKLRLTTMVLITTAMGFYLASVNGLDWPLLLHALFGTGILAGGAAALNEYLEKDFDANIMKQWTRSDILLKKDGWLYCCETIQDAEIISEESLG